MLWLPIAGDTMQPCQLYPPHTVLNLAEDMDRAFVLAGARFGGSLLGSSACMGCLGTAYASCERQSDLVTDN